MINRLAILPIISSQFEVIRESEFISWFSLAKEWKNVTIYFILNNDAEIPAEYKLSNIVYVRVKDWFPFNVNYAVVSSEMYELFNPVNGRYQVDVLFTSRTIVGANLFRLFRITDQLKLPIILFESWVPKTEGSLSSEIKLKGVAYSECPTIFLTGREKNFSLSALRYYFSGSVLNRINSNSIVQTSGIFAKEIAKRALRVKKFDKFTLFFAGRLNANKRWKEILHIYQDFYRSSNDIQIKVIALGSKIGEEVRSEFDVIEFLEPKSFYDYLEFLCKCHLSVSMSIDEGFSNGWTEQMATGNPVIFPDRDWVWELFGKNYPFLYRNNDELFAMMKWVKKDYAEARKKVQSIAQMVIDKYDISLAAQRFLDLAQKQMTDTWLNFDEWENKWKKVIDEMPDEFNFDAFIKQAKSMYRADFGNYVVLIGAYRNIYMMLKKFTIPVLGKENNFRKTKNERADIP